MIFVISGGFSPFASWYSIFQIEDKIKELDGVIRELEIKRDAESGDVMKKLESALSEKQKLEAVAQSAVDNKKEGLKAENKRKKELTKNLNDVSALLIYNTKISRQFRGQKPTLGMA